MADSLIAYEKDQEFRQQQQLLTNAAEDAAQLKLQAEVPDLQIAAQLGPGGQKSGLEMYIPR